MSKSENNRNSIGTVLDISGRRCQVSVIGMVWILFISFPFSTIEANKAYSFPFTQELKSQSDLNGLSNLFFLEELCGDGIDNDNDGKTDCEDEDCGPQIINVQFTVPSACEATDGTISISVSGGIPPYRFSIDNGLSWQTNAGNYTNLGNDTYNIRVANTDESCIKAYQSIDVYNSESPILDSVVVNNPTLCFLNDGTLDIYARGTGLEYSIDGGVTFSNQSSYSDLSPGLYRVRVRKGACEVSHSNSFIVEPECTTNIIIPSGSPADRCLWQLNETINLDLDGNIDPGIEDTYVLINTDGIILDVSSNSSLASQSTAGIYIAFILGVENGTTVNGLTAGNYIQEIDIESLCYQWSAGFPIEICPSTETDCTDGFDNDGDGMTDCEDDDCSPIFLSINKSDPSDCELNNGSIIVTVDQGQGFGYVYSIDNGISWQSSPAFSNLSGGLYTILVANSDETCPRISPDIILDSPTPPTVLNVLSGNSTSCDMANGSITVIASGAMGLNYSINNGISYQSSNQFTGLTGGTYQIRVQNDDGTCTISEGDVQLTDPIEPVINSVNSISPSACGLSDGTITINATGNNIEYSINGGNTYASSNVFTGLGEGTFNVAVRNNDGSCRILSGQNPFNLTSGAVVDITNVMATHPSSCDGTQGQIEITASGIGALQYSIDNGGTFQSSNIFTGLSGGDYEIVVSNLDATCPETFPLLTLIQESEGSIQNVSVSHPTDCGLSDGTITVISNPGSANLEYRLDNGAWQSSNTFNNMASGEYQVSIRNVGGKCEVIGESSSITDPVPPQVTNLDFTNDVRCDSDNGTITLSASGNGGLEFSIDGGTSWSSSGQFNNLSVGDYPTAVRNADGTCQINHETVSISENINLFSISLNKTDPLCYGDTNGSIVPSMQGGVEPFSYDWSNGSSELSLTGMGTGAYSLTVTDANGCSGESSTSLIEPSALNSSAISQDDELCNNCLVITADGGVGPYDYSADGINFQQSSTISDLQAGMHTLMVRDANACLSTYQVEVIDLNPLSCTISIVSEISCTGGSDGSFEVIIHDGEAPFEYSLDNINFVLDNEFTGLIAGDYTVYVSDNADNNSSCMISIAESQNEVQASSSVVNNESCFNHQDGRISVSASGGQGVLQYSVDGENYQTESLFENLAAGNYIITVIDDNGCSAQTETNITAAPDLFCTIIVNEGVSCVGNNDGRIVAEAIGGFGNIVFSLNGQTSPDGEFTNLASGSYLIQITDDNGCFSTCAVIVTEGAQLNCSVVQLSHVSCTGASDGSVQVSLDGASGSITYELNGATNTTGFFQGLSGGAYAITASDQSGCLSECEITIEEGEPLVCNISSFQDISCFGEDDGAFTASISGGTGSYSYLLNGNAIESPIVSGLSGGNYIFSVQDQNGCSSECEIFISEPNELSCTSTVLSNVQCSGGDEGSVRINAIGGVGARTFTLNGESNSTGVFENLSGGSYSVSVGDENGCLSFCSFEIAEPGGLDCSITSFNNISCDGGNDGSITIGSEGGQAPFSYSIDGLNFISANNFNNLDPGFYIINIRDANGCQGSCSITLTEPTGLQCVVNEFVDVNCSDEANGRIVVSGTGGIPPYQYSLNNAPFQGSGVFDNLSAGSYNVQVMDENGCISMCDLMVNQPNDLLCNITNVTNTTCSSTNSGTISVQGMGGQVPYQYSIDGINYQTNNTFNNLGSGVYTISIRDDENCAVSCDVVTIEAIGGLSCIITGIEEAGCGEGDGGQIVAGNIGGASPIEYSIDGLIFQSGNIFENVPAGAHELTIRDANGCTSTCTAEVGVRDNLVPTVDCEISVINLDCDPSTIPDGNALISQGLISASDEDGTATVQVIDESISNLGCEYTSTIRFRAVDNCGQVSPLESACSIEVKWTVSEDLIVNCPENLNLSCGDVDNPMIIENWLSSISAEDPCGGGITVTHTYSENGFVSTCSDGVGMQVVTFTVEDECGNTTSCSAQIEIADDKAPQLSDTPENLTISQNDPVPIAPEITASDECSVASVSLEESIGTLVCGSTIERTWTASDECGNTTAHTQIITIENILESDIESINHIHCFGGSGSASVVITQGTEPYSFQWSNGAESASVDNLDAGVHNVTVSDASGCSAILDVEIFDVDILQVTINVDQPVACNLYSLASISLNIQGGVGDYSVQWTDGPTEIERSGVDIGSYSVLVTDSNGCVAEASVELEETGTCTAGISGNVWEDMRRDGIRDEEDQVVVSMVIVLLKADGTVLKSTQSNELGIFEFTDLPADQFMLKAEIPEGFGITSDAEGEDNAFNNSTKMTDIISLETGQLVENIDLGIYQLGKISGIVWNDNNQNGILDANEEGIFNAWVKLLDENQELLASTFSDEAGLYSFINLPPGTYFIEFDGVESLSGSPNGQGEDPSSSSQADPGTGITPAIQVLSGDCYENVNAGFFGVFDLELTLSAANTLPVENELIAFSILIENKGDIDGEDISVKASLGEGLRNPISISKGGTADGSMVIWEGLSVASNRSLTLAYRAEVGEFAIGQDYTTLVEITNANEDDFDSTPGNQNEGLNEDDEDSIVTAPEPPSQSDLGLTMSVNDDSGLLTYFLRLENSGPDNATGIELVNYLPAGQVENITGINGNGLLQGSQITWIIDELNSGDAIEFSFQASVLDGITGEDIINSAEVKSVDQFDPNSTPDNFGAIPVENDEAMTITSIDKVADLELNIMDDDSLRRIGETVKVVIQLENKGSDVASMARIVNYIPNGFTRVMNISDGGSLVGNRIIWTTYDLNADQSMMCSFEAELTAVVDDCGDAYLNIAEVMESSAKDPDSSPGNQLSKSEDDDDSIMMGINPEICININTKIFLEGAYVPSQAKMNNKLYQNGYLPGQNPQTFFGNHEESGQPYNGMPWDYCGLEGEDFDAMMEGADDFANYPDNTVDWILVSLRSERKPGTVVCRKSGLVMDNGEVLMVEGFDCCGFTDGEEYYVVVEHRNHLPIMSTEKVPIENSFISYDFTTQNSFIALLGTGQKEVNPGEWAMIAGNGDQDDFIQSGDINVNDLSKWSMEEGQNSGYYSTDFDLNGDVNVQDKGIILRSFGVFSDVNNK